VRSENAIMPSRREFLSDALGIGLITTSTWSIRDGEEGSGIDRPHDRELQDVNIAFFDFVSWAGTSACMTSQCSTRRPLSTRKMSTATIGSGAQPT
jgi:hypothetical protein